MYRRLRLLALAVAALAALTAIPAMALAAAGDGADAQQGEDVSTGTVGAWSDSTVGVAGRPFIKRLSITNGGTETLIIDNPTGLESPTIIGSSGANVMAIVSGYNICKPPQTPSTDRCYANPNRISVGLRHYTAGQWSDDFTTAGATTTPAVTESSIVDITVGFRAAFSTLGWSWLNGSPSYWEAGVVSGTGGDVHVKFAPTTMPSLIRGEEGFCTAIPVSSCDARRSASELLRTEWILSVDDTLGAEFRGTLFASKAAVIGSLEAIPGSATVAPQLTYGVAAPHELPDGTPRVGTFYALVPEALLPSFGTTMAAFDPAIMSVTRITDTTGALPSTTTWTPWQASANGTTGQFLTISNISFSAPKFLVTSKAKDEKKAASVKLKKGRTITLMKLAQSTRTAFGRSDRLRASVARASRRYCAVVGPRKDRIRGLKAGTCRLTLTVIAKSGKRTANKVTIVVTR